jgi:hypothetical protein
VEGADLASVEEVVDEDMVRLSVVTTLTLQLLRPLRQHTTTAVTTTMGRDMPLATVTRDMVTRRTTTAVTMDSPPTGPTISRAMHSHTQILSPWLERQNVEQPDHRIIRTAVNLLCVPH